MSAVQRDVGAIGCTESHIAVLEMAIREGWKCVLVLEDDAMWGDDFESSYGILETLVTKEHDVIVLGGHYTFWDAESMKLHSTFGTEGYIVRSHYYSTLLDVFKSSLVDLKQSNMPWRDGLDVHWNRLVQRDNWFVVRPNLMKQRTGFSDIRKEVVDYHT
jgi:glycosyl transferase family 25